MFITPKVPFESILAANSSNWDKTHKDFTSFPEYQKAYKAWLLEKQKTDLLKRPFKSTFRDTSTAVKPVDEYQIIRRYRNDGSFYDVL